MTLPSSGPLSMSAINAEFGRGNNLNSYRGTVWYTDAGASGTFSSGAISFSEFYGKRPTSPTFSFTISANQTNANLRTLAVNAGWNQSSAVVATIASGVFIYSTSTGTPALTINGSFPGGVTLVNNGTIQGMGGAAGAGGASFGGVGRAGAAGSGGGLALSVSVGVSINNGGGRIAGGGGGGGGGGGAYQFAGKSGTFSAGGGGGGGGLGGNGGAGGAGGVASVGNTRNGNAGGGGTLTSNGGGGAGGNSSGIIGGTGGAGGSYGAGGGTGGNGNVGAGAGAGGGPGGGAVSGNANISWIAFGTRNGGIS